ncbi:MAG: 4-hydroxy-tetrahydrodipicolinate reductase [Cyanobacteria bacterium P01_H01_bin.74]
MTSPEKFSENPPITVVVTGAKGKMGTTLLKTLCTTPEIKVVGVTTRQVNPGETVGDWLNLKTPESTNTNNTEPHKIQTALLQLPFSDALTDLLSETQPDVCVDLTTPDSVFANAITMINADVRPVIGTTGLTSEQLTLLDEQLTQKGLGGLVVPNFALGAVLMMKFAQLAAKYMPHAEIIERHHNQKADAPSGTALKTAALMQDAQSHFGQTNATETESHPGARGAKARTGQSDAIHIHSVRLPGSLAHQEVLFGAPGQTLRIQHDTIDRTCFMSGIVLCIHKVLALKGLTYGMENLIE